MQFKAEIVLTPFAGAEIGFWKAGSDVDDDNDAESEKVH